MRKPTITPSMLETWDYYLAELIPLEDLKRSVLREKDEPNENMIIGQGYNELISGGFGSYGGYLWDLESATSHGVTRLNYGLLLEVPVELEYEHFKLSGRVDGISTDGVIHEFKASSKDKSYLDYYNSQQWRCYAIMADAQVVYSAIRWKLQGKTVITSGLKRFDFRGGNDTEQGVLAHAKSMLDFCDLMEWKVR